MTSAKKIYLAVAGGLVAAGVVLAGIGFIASGFDPAVFTTQIGEVDTSGITASESPAAPEAPTAP